MATIWTCGQVKVLKNGICHHMCEDGTLMTDKCITRFYSLIISVFDKKHMLHGVILH